MVTFEKPSLVVVGYLGCSWGVNVAATPSIGLQIPRWKIPIIEHDIVANKLCNTYLYWIQLSVRVWSSKCRLITCFPRFMLGSTFITSAKIIKTYTPVPSAFSILNNYKRLGMSFCIVIIVVLSRWLRQIWKMYFGRIVRSLVDPGERVVIIEPALPSDWLKVVCFIPLIAQWCRSFGKSFLAGYRW